MQGQSVLFSIKEYLKHLFSSIHLHGIHSPFVYEFNRDIIQNKDRYYIFDEIDALRSLLLLSDQKIQHTDFGAGSKTGNKSVKKIKQIAKTSAKSPKYGELLFRIAKFSEAKNILELGTSLGLSTAYLSSATTASKVTTIEGCPNIAKVAKLNFRKLEISNIDQRIGEFDHVLPNVLKENSSFDLIFFDGNHTEEATLKYFEQCSDHIHNKSIFVFDDIYWSVGMKKAWDKIVAHPKVTVSIDLFQMGIVFFRKGQEKEHFTIHH